jgi:hypothetical protein
MKIYPNKKTANYSFEREKLRYHCATFHNEIHPRENNLILIPSGQTNKIIFTLGRHGNFTVGVTSEQPDLLCTALALNIELLSIIVYAVLETSY